MPVKVSHTIDLGPDLPNEIMDIARKQGEDPERVCADIQELRDMIFGKEKKRFYLTLRYSWIVCNVLFLIERGVCVPPRNDDEFLIRFLRARFFKLEHAYNLVGNQFIYVTNDAVIYSNFNKC